MRFWLDKWYEITKGSFSSFIHFFCFYGGLGEGVVLSKGVIGLLALLDVLMAGSWRRWRGFF